ncbi:MAG: MFS transporter [Deltaproteobacteria bacterium]|jgi:MFS transporter, DHA1 family, inner membrane transport protein|nr:MFS transporter [Deltaproteobacteria bacterium]MBT4262893.1 MFS transporter [Deltaproteobacteria bacterium]MBT4644194.1 MFS transporter [Deltaproteobacteria bacterium]MBT6502708.1 MFS transporter [Deltaproteobacteria bacterium]
MEYAKNKFQKKLFLNFIVITFSRLLLNTSRRFVYTFAAAFSRGLGVPLTSITSLIAVNQGTSVLGIFFGPLGDRLGYKFMILIGMSFLAVGMLAAGILPFYWVIAIAMLLSGLGKSIVDPAIQAYVGQRVPYRRRGLIIGMMEFAWAGSTLIGIPLMGLLIEKLGWQAPFIAIGLMALISVILVAALFPSDQKQKRQAYRLQETLILWKQILTNRSALGALLFALFVSIANDNIFVVYGAWLEDSFNLSIVALGIGTSVIGIAEIFGESMTAFLSDKIGLKKAVFLGLGVSACSFAVLPLANQNLTAALASLFLIFVSFEFTYVTFISLCTELAPGSRATMISAFYAVAGIGRVIGAVLGGKIWEIGHLPGISLASTGFTLLALIALVWGLWGWKRDHK